MPDSGHLPFAEEYNIDVAGICTGPEDKDAIMHTPVRDLTFYNLLKDALALCRPNFENVVTSIEGFESFVQDLNLEYGKVLGFSCHWVVSTMRLDAE